MSKLAHIVKGQKIPHQRPASCWTANDEGDFCAKLAQEFGRHGDTPAYDATFAEWRDYLARDLYALHVFMNEDDAALAALDDATFSGHQGASARAALRQALIDNNVIDGE